MDRPTSVSEIQEQTPTKSPRCETLDDALLSEDQQLAIAQVLDWVKKPKKQTLVLAGRAGSGKTTIIKKILSLVPDREVGACSFTGKAVFVMRNKGLSQAQTMHSMMYNPDGKDKNGRPIFRKKQGIPYGLVVVDEGSMVSKELNQDLLSFGVKVLYVGDHWQLEPVGENPNLMAKPDIVLEKIHRQARDSNILMFADAVYRGQSYFPHRKLYDLEVAPSHRFWPALKEVEIGLVSKNDVRLRANEHVRRQKGFSGPLPQVGERVICLRNDRDCGVYNGLLGTVTKTSLQKKVYMIDVVDDLENKYEDLPTFPSQYGRNSMADTVEREFLLFDYGYVLTVHKAQGSEWNSGVVLEVDLWPGMEHNRWRYTAVTRIAKRLIYCR